MQAQSVTNPPADPAGGVYFSPHEILKVMLKEKGIHSGLWMLQIEFNMGVGNFGPNEAEALPTTFIGVARVGMLPVTLPNPSSLVVDAAIVNPAQATVRARTPRKRIAKSA